MKMIVQRLRIIREKLPGFVDGRAVNIDKKTLEKIKMAWPEIDKVSLQLLRIVEGIVK